MNFESVYEFQNSGTFPQPDYDAERVPHVLAPAATGVDEFISQHGGDVDRVFGEAGVDQKCIGIPTKGVSLKSFCGLFEISLREHPERQFRIVVRQPVSTQ